MPQALVVFCMPLKTRPSNSRLSCNRMFVFLFLVVAPNDGCDGTMRLPASDGNRQASGRDKPRKPCNRLHIGISVPSERLDKTQAPAPAGVRPSSQCQAFRYPHPRLRGIHGFVKNYLNTPLPPSSLLALGNPLLPPVARVLAPHPYKAATINTLRIPSTVADLRRMLEIKERGLRLPSPRPTFGHCRLPPQPPPY